MQAGLMGKRKKHLDLKCLISMKLLQGAWVCIQVFDDSPVNDAFPGEQSTSKTPLTKEGGDTMSYKFLSVMAVLVLVAGCGTAPTEEASTSGGGLSTSESDSSMSESGSSTSGSSASDSSTSNSSTSSGSQVSSVPAVMAGSQEDLVVNVGDRVFFDFDRFDLSQEARGILEKQAVWLQTHRGAVVTIGGHTDERGTREYNLGLGERRANSVKDYLVALGVNPDRINTVSYGEERPVAVGSNEAAWAQNRRATTTVAGSGS